MSVTTESTPFSTIAGRLSLSAGVPLRMRLLLSLALPTGCRA